MEKAQTTPQRDTELFECRERGNILGAEVSRLKGRVGTLTGIALGLGGGLVLATGAFIGSWLNGRKRTE